MAKFEQLFKDVAASEDIKYKSQFAAYMISVVERAGKVIAPEYEGILKFAEAELNKIPSMVAAAHDYKEKDEIFEYYGALGTLVNNVLNNGKLIMSSSLSVAIDRVYAIIENECKLEVAVENAFRKKEKSETDVFGLNEVEKVEIDKIINVANTVTDEYKRGALYRGLLDNAKELPRMTEEAKRTLVEFVERDLERYLQKAELNEDEAGSLEIAVDVCKSFASEKILDLLGRVVLIKNSAVRFYTIATLLEKGRTVPQDVVTELANDIQYADLLFSELGTYGKQDMFPSELNNREYLAKSNLVHWLVYPTELGKEPDEIVYLGSADVKKERYEIFKYKSDSDNLASDCKNTWLIGWASGEGGTFSNFDKLTDYRKATPEKTLRYITKKLLK